MRWNVSEVDRIIRDWRSVAVDDTTHDIFFRFIALWIAFNAYYISRYHRYDDSDARVADRKYVRRFGQEHENVARHRQLVKSRDAYAAAVQVLAARGVQDAVSGEITAVHDSADLLQVIEAVYLVRCNIFHGGKLRGEPRDEKVTSAAFAILSGLLETAFAGKGMGEVDERTA